MLIVYSKEYGMILANVRRYEKYHRLPHHFIIKPAKFG